MKKLSFELVNRVPRVSQTFISLEGEGINIGEPSFYVRLAGCYSAACSFCDTKFSWNSKKKFSKLYEKNKLSSEFNLWCFSDWIDSIIENQKNHKDREINRLTITGGEPLHYISSLNEKFLCSINDPDLVLNGIDIKWLGIESNGNLLSKKEILFELIKIFNILQKNNIIPNLTISPKIDSESCYEGQVSNSRIDKIYKNVYQNISDYFSFNVYFKFVWNVNPDMNNKIIEHINVLNKLGIENKRIFLMPFTPDNPLGKDRKKWEESKDVTAKKALELGVRYSPRIHVDRKLD